jgi:hypothetical protein
MKNLMDGKDFPFLFRIGEMEVFDFEFHGFAIAILNPRSKKGKKDKKKGDLPWILMSQDALRILNISENPLHFRLGGVQRGIKTQ